MMVLKQLEPGRTLEIGQLPADRRLRRVQRHRGIGGGAGFHNGFKGLNLLKTKGLGHPRAPYNLRTKAISNVHTHVSTKYFSAFPAVARLVAGTSNMTRSPARNL